MKNISIKIAIIAITFLIALEMFSCSNGNEPVLPPAPYNETVAKPTFSIISGEVECNTKVTLSCSTEGAKIFYTTNGNTPTSAATEYAAPISITEAITIKAIAVKEGMNNSAVASTSYTIKDFVLISAGNFNMGSNEGEDNCYKPVHNVTLSKAFYMCNHEVTQAEYQAIMGNNPSQDISNAANGEIQENRPVEHVNWFSAVIYCNKRSISEGLTPCYTMGGKTDPDKWGEIPDIKWWEEPTDPIWDAIECNWNANGYRLPTEAEWEYSARAGDNTINSLIWSGTKSVTELNKFAWYYDSKTHEVKKTQANAYGLYDMSGNVAEWCWDYWPEQEPYLENNATDPTGNTSVSARIVRGGLFGSDALSCTVYYRMWDNPYNNGNYIGFRICRTAGN